MDDTIQRILRIKAALARQHQNQSPQSRQTAQKPTVQPLHQKEITPEVNPIQSDGTLQDVSSSQGDDTLNKKMNQT